MRPATTRCWTGTGRETRLGGNDDNALRGGSHEDVLLSGLSNDSQRGGLGTDTLASTDGDDVIVRLASEIDEVFSG